MENLQAIRQLVTENSEYANKLNEAKLYAAKWEETGLLENLKGIDKSNMAIMLENQARQLLKESSHTSTSAGGEEWSGVALPLVRRVIDNISAKDLVAVQPMSLPSGLVFYLDFVEKTSGGSVYGDVQNGDPTGGLYGPKHSYADGSKFDVFPSAESSGSNILALATLADDAAGRLRLNHDSRKNPTAYSTITVTTGVLPNIQMANLADVSIKLEHRSATNTIETSDPYTSLTILPQFTKYTVNVAEDGTDTSTVSFVTLNAVATAFEAAESEHDVALVSYPVLSVESRTGRFEDVGLDLELPEIEMKLSQEPIIAKIRKLKAVFSPEIQQDLQAYHAIDANVELTKMLADKISAEIDLEILSMLANGADGTNTAYWSARPGYEWNSTINNFEDKSTNYAIQSKTDWFKTLGVAIRKVSNMIYRKTLMGGANFAVVSPEVATLLESFPGFNTEIRSMKHMSFGVQEIGMLNNEIMIYKNPYWVSNRILLGHKGQGSLDTGAVYAPYVPLMVSPLVHSADNFTPRKAISSRYATKLLRPEFYGVIYCSGLESV